MVDHKFLVMCLTMDGKKIWSRRLRRRHRTRLSPGLRELRVELLITDGQRLYASRLARRLLL
jgi:hypothetical protein